jgi:hypothetical protein
MTVRCVLAFVLVAALGCGGGEEDDQPMPDAKVATRACDGRIYDLCTDTTNHSDCMPGLVCRFQTQQNITICTPACDAATPCPLDENGGQPTCNKMGYCRTEVANACF